MVKFTKKRITFLKELGLSHELPEYVREPLRGSHTIRVIDIHTNMNRLECKISQVEVGTDKYQALSYEWGDAKEPYKVIVRDERGINGYIPLTENLNRALMDLRDSPEIKDKRFWIDQISINQKDDLERGHQVQSMASIYRNASRVIVYLGSHFRKRKLESRALRLLDQIHDHFKPNYEHLQDHHSLHRCLHDTSWLPVRSLNGIGSRESFLT